MAKMNKYYKFVFEYTLISFTTICMILTYYYCEIYKDCSMKHQIIFKIGQIILIFLQILAIFYRNKFSTRQSIYSYIPILIISSLLLLSIFCRYTFRIKVYKFYGVPEDINTLSQKNNKIFVFYSDNFLNKKIIISTENDNLYVTYKSYIYNQNVNSKNPRSHFNIVFASNTDNEDFFRKVNNFRYSELAKGAFIILTGNNFEAFAQKNGINDGVEQFYEIYNNS